jgi:hypothetical protein
MSESAWWYVIGRDREARSSGTLRRANPREIRSAGPAGGQERLRSLTNASFGSAYRRADRHYVKMANFGTTVPVARWLSLTHNHCCR